MTGPQRGGGGGFGVNPIAGNVLVVSVMGITGHIAVDEMGLDGTKAMDKLRALDAAYAEAVT